MDSLDPGHAGDAETHGVSGEHLITSLVNGHAHQNGKIGASDPFAPITGKVSALPKGKSNEVWEPQLPAPVEPPNAKQIRHIKHGPATRCWVYRNADGAPLFAAIRFDFTKDDGTPGKEVIPYSYGRRQWTTSTGKRRDVVGWHFKRPAVPVPLYGLDRLAARPGAKVLLCEGEKSADAVGVAFPDFVAIAAQGGCKAPEKSNWSAIAGRTVLVWPDADKGGIDFANDTAELMHDAGAASIRIVPIVPSEWPDGWDLADKLPAGISVERLRELLDAAESPSVHDQDNENGADPADLDEPASDDALAELEAKAGSDDDATDDHANGGATDAEKVISLVLQKAFRLDDVEYHLRRGSIADEVGLGVSALDKLRAKHLKDIADKKRARERADLQRIKDEKAQARQQKRDEAEAEARKKKERERRLAEASAEHRAKSAPDDGAVLWPYDIEARADGLYYVPPDDPESEESPVPLWLCAPIEVLGLARDIAGESWSVLLRWRDKDNKERTWTMPSKLVVSKPGELEGELMDRGLGIDTNARQKSYLRHALGGVITGARVALVDAPGWTSPIIADKSFMLINGENIGKTGEPTILKAPPQDALAKMKQLGTLDEWKSLVAAKAVGNSVASFAICASFAGPLLDPLNESSGGFHFFGRSKEGKTLAMQMGISVWGLPSTSGLLRSWRTTANALESAAEESNDGLLALDEIHLAEAKEVVAAAYLIANGVGKQRLRSDASAQRRRSWRTVVLSNGELTLAAMAAKAEQTLPAGAEIRLPSISIDGHAMWPKLHGAESATDFVGGMHLALSEQYGTAIRPFLAKLTEAVAEHPDDLKAKWEDCREKFFEKLPKGACDQVREVTRRCALIATAGELAIEWGVLPWKTGAAENAVYEVLSWWLDRRDGTASTSPSISLAGTPKALAAAGLGA